MVLRINTRLEDSRRIAVVSPERGVGKTTTTLMLGHVMALYRGDRIVCLDIYPESTSLSKRMGWRQGYDLLDLLTSPHELRRYSDVSSYTTRAPTRLEVLAGPAHRAVSDGLTADDYARVAELLDVHYGVICADVGSAVVGRRREIFELCDQVVLVCAASIQSARECAQALEWLHQNGHSDLAEDAVCVVNATIGKKGAAELDPGDKRLIDRNGLVKLDRMEEKFFGRAREVVRVPWDQTLDVQATPVPTELEQQTQKAYMRLASVIAAGF